MIKKWIAVSALLLGFSLAAPGVRAQKNDNVELGIFGEYYGLHATGSNFGGLGARASFGTHVAQLEAELGYDFSQVFTEGFTNPNTHIITFTNSHESVLHGLFGPKIQTPGRFKLFATVKGGFIHVGFSDRPGSFNSFSSSVTSLRTNNVDATFYPGGGFEALLGPVTLRLEAGDEIYFNGGAHNNLKITFGPGIRF